MFDEFRDIVKKARSIRRFDQSYRLTHEELEELVDLARLSPSGANLQPLKYILAVDDTVNERIFLHLRWAGYLRNWNGPAKGERPAGYIVILGDREIAKNFTGWPARIDDGIAAEVIMLGAAIKELGCCIIAAIDRDGLRVELDIADRFEILLAIAIGKPAERVELEGFTDSIEYYRRDNIHHVPKRDLDEIIVGRY